MLSKSTLAKPVQVYLIRPHEVTSKLPPLAAACDDHIRASFNCQRETSHQLVDDPSVADILIATVQQGGFGPCLEKLRTSSVFKKFFKKLIVYSPDDNQFPAVRGLYPSVNRRWASNGWALPAHYLSSHIHRFHFQPEEIHQKDILFSFVGSSRTHKVREQIVQIRHPEGIIIDSSPRSDPKYWWEKPNIDDFFATFRDVTRRSRFAICPRGKSPSSIRLFEAMEAGCVPVIVADDIVLPDGPCWDDFIVRVPERNATTIPEQIKKFNDSAENMGKAARLAWETHFSDGATANSIVRWARKLLTPARERPLANWLDEYTNPWMIRAKIRANFVN